MAQQTAVEWLVNQEIVLDLGSGIKMKIPIPQNVIEQAQAMFQEQIIDAWRNGDNDSMYSPKELDQQAEQYYNETYLTIDTK